MSIMETETRMALPPSIRVRLAGPRDCEALCAAEGFEVLQREVLDNEHRATPLMRLMPNLLAEVALYRFRKAV